jgi:hypothetical protein
MKETLIQVNILSKEFTPRLLQLLSDSSSRPISADKSGIDQIRIILEKLEDELRQSKKENSHLKERLSDLSNR